MHSLFSVAAVAAIVLPLVSAHGFIQEVSFDGGAPVKAQKTDLAQSPFRAVSQNTGWIGSDFLNSKCLVCGCSNDPFGEVAAPGGTTFSDASQSAGQTSTIAAGKSLQLLVAGNPGEGWPHATGHLQVYLGKCADATSCSNFDASTAQFFKIMSIPNGAAQLKAAFNSGRDGNPWSIQIPAAVPSGAYIMRAEIIAYGQSSAAEGHQVQFYPFCGQINVEGGGNATKLETVQFPQVYASDNLIVSQGISHVPGPQVDAAFGGSGTFTGGNASLEPTANSGAGATTNTPTTTKPMNGGNGKMMNGNGKMMNGNGKMMNGNNGGKMMHGDGKKKMMGHNKGMMHKKPPCDKKKPPVPVQNFVSPPPSDNNKTTPPSPPPSDNNTPLAGSAHARHRARQEKRRRLAQKETIFS